MTTYSQKTEKVMEAIATDQQEREEATLLIGGDFNARIEEEGGPFGKMRLTHSDERRLRDKTINKEGRILIERVKENGFVVQNGCFGRETGWTYIGERGASVIDYVLTNEKAIEEVMQVTEGERTESDHIPLELQ